MAAIINTMSRDFTQGYAGIDYVLLSDFSAFDVSSYTAADSTGYVNFTTELSTNWVKVVPRIGTSNFTETGNINRANGANTYTQNLSLSFPANTVVKRNAIATLGNKEIRAIIVDKNGTAICYGAKNGLTLTAPTFESGTVGGDYNGMKMVFAGDEPVPAYYIDSSTLKRLTP